MENTCKVRSKPKSVKEFFTTWYFWKPFLGVTVGLLAGFFVTGSPCSRFGR